MSCSFIPGQGQRPSHYQTQHASQLTSQHILAVMNTRIEADWLLLIRGERPHYSLSNSVVVRSIKLV